MILKKIVLNNISSYEGCTTFDFTVQKDKNIILIGGKNGAGKTSLFNAIKIGLYGPLNFNYQTVHAQYLSKIKDIITKKAFTDKNVEAFVYIEFDYIQDRECMTYTLKRSWTYTNHKLEETFEVSHNGHILNEEELIYFDKFLQTILPPNLFSLFFFDGEELSDVFVGSKFNNYIKEAFMVLGNFDNFELIKKHAKNYIARNTHSSETDTIRKALDELRVKLDKTEKLLTTYSNERTALEELLQEYTISKETLDQDFKLQGGLSQDEQEALSEEIRKHELNKTKQSYAIKNFLEEMMPLIIIEQFAPKIKAQITKEQSYQQQQHALSYLDSSNTQETILHTLNSLLQGSDNLESVSKTIQTNLIASIKETLSNNTFEIIHQLSSEQQNQVLSLIQRIESFNKNTILNAISSKQESQKITSLLNEKLRNAMPTDVVATYLRDVEKLNKLLLATQENLLKINQSIELTEAEKTTLENEYSQLRAKLINATHDKSVYDLTNNIQSMLDAFIKESSQHKLRELEMHFKDNFQLLFRKQNFIDEIRIDESFTISIYRKKVFTYAQIERLINHLGNVEFEKYVGPLSLDVLYSHFASYNATTVSDLKALLEKQLLVGTELEIYERINLNQLSKGEKQIYMLSLYWALIKISAHEVPFIIDTPYARIDTEHRDNVTSNFLPNVAHQVIILSTDEEIDANYYNILKPYIAKEYLLVFNTENKHTEIFNKYFYEVEQ